MKVLITRSQPGADQLAAAVRQAGMTVVVTPLFEVVANVSAETTSILMNLDRFDQMIFVSTHAVASALPEIDRCWPQWPSLEWLAVGRATARALAEWRVQAVCPEQESSEGILAMPNLLEVSGQRVLLVCGRGGRTLIEDTLADRGAEVTRLEVYERRPRDVDQAALEGEQVDVVVVSSGEAGQRLLDIWPGAAGCTIVAPSARVAGGLEARGCTEVRVADGATASAVVEVLDQLNLD